MQTLTFGFKKPTTGDRGAVFFPALEENIQKLNDHTHNGADSQAINSKDITPFKQTVAPTWSPHGPQGYRTEITIPNGKLYDDFVITFRDSATGAQLLLSTQKTSPTTYYVFINDPSINLVVHYL